MGGRRAFDICLARHYHIPNLIFYRRTMPAAEKELADYLYAKIAEAHGLSDLPQKDKLIRFREAVRHLFFELTRGEKTYLSDLNDRMIYVFGKKYPDTPREIQDAAHRLRRYCNRAVHDLEFKTGDDAYRSCLRAALDVVAHFTGQKPPAGLESAAGDAKPSGIPGWDPPPREIIPFLEATVLDVRRQTDKASPNALLLCDTDELGEIAVTLWDNARQGANPGSRFILLADLVWKYARIHFFNLQKVPGRDSLYSARATDSVAVLDPDYLMDVSELAECFQVNGAFPQISLLNLFKPKEPSAAATVGLLANRLLDELILHYNKKTADEIIADGLREHALSCLSVVCGPGGAFRPETLEDIRTRARLQNPTILKFTREYPRSEWSAHVEPAFISPRYGMQGRLDFLAQDRGTPSRRDIVELKSGKPPESDRWPVWPNHRMQAEGYRLLVESAFPDRSGTDFILYSACPPSTQFLRMNADSPAARQDLMLLRNRIVSALFRMSAGDLSALDGLSPEQWPEAGKIHDPFRREFLTARRDADALESAYFRAFTAFTAREQRAAKTGNSQPEGPSGFASLWKSTRDEKRSSYGVLENLTVESVTADFTITLACDMFSNPVSDFRKGDIALLYPSGSRDAPLSPRHCQVLKCTVTDVRPDRVAVRLRHRQAEQEAFRSGTLWTLEHDLIETSYRSMYQSLFRFLSAPRDLRSRLLGVSRPSFGPPGFRIAGTGEPSADAALEKALSARDYCLVQGPPGTGKTTVLLAGIAKNLAQNTDENFVVLAYTNRAVEEIGDCLRNARIPFIHLGRVDSGDDENWRSVVRGASLEEVRSRVLSTRVFLSTVSSFLQNQELLGLKNFRTVIVDEASQLLEPYLAGLLTRFERFILIGDEKQLPAVVLQPTEHTAVADAELKKAGFADLSESLFGRLVRNAQNKNWDCVCTLTRQGRMHEHIAAFPNREFYGGVLETAREDQKGPITLFSGASADPFEKALAASRVLFVPTATGTRPRINSDQARLAGGFVRAVSRVYGTAFTDRTVGVITPYRAQIANILRMGDIPPELQDLVAIDTVERFQGSQRDVIILSLPLNSPVQFRSLQSFTPDGRVDRKLNVAITRARSHLIILGPPDILSRNPEYGKLLAFIRESGGETPL